MCWGQGLPEGLFLLALVLEEGCEEALFELDHFVGLLRGDSPQSLSLVRTLHVPVFVCVCLCVPMFCFVLLTADRLSTSVLSFEWTEAWFDCVDYWWIASGVRFFYHMVGWNEAT